eukprot:TRINITY_DN682_c1_g1_i1.p1 TRINITY_DN682_c1_g1~~TRINITY_DN682_c1_g1_i1.p1  ORF type:complete len:243 (+),score=39.31 TRINITY_DN682_c1_g1_i1:123-851(+)
MLLSSEQWLHTGPPPQEILDQLPLWKLLIVGFGVEFVLKVIVVDAAGALLTALLLGFAWVMLREGMQEMPKYALIYAVLCGLNFLFDVLPLMNELSGRTTRVTQVNRLPEHADGSYETQYTLSTKVTSFFDRSMGFAYNAESFAMLLDPCIMALGCYLSTTAHQEIQRTLPSFEDFPDVSVTMDSPRPTPAQEARLRAIITDREAGQDSNPSHGQDAYLHFHGSSYKLSGSRSPSPNPGHRF